MRELLDNFEPGDLVMGDAYYSSYWLIAELISRGVDVLMEGHGARDVDFRRGKRLGKKDHLVQWEKPKARPCWMTQEEYDAYPELLTVREIHAGTKVLVTTLQSPKDAPCSALKTLYRERWGIELRLRDIKETLKMGVLRCKTPEMVEKEIWVHLLAYNMIRVVMSGSAAHTKTALNHISFKHTVQFFFCIRLFETGTLFMGEMFWLIIAQIRVGYRPGRMEPRCVKRRQKPYQKMTKPRAALQEEIRKNGRSQREYALK